MVAAEGSDKVAYLDNLFGVKAYSRLVEDDNLGVSDQRLRDSDPLPVAL